MHCRVNIFGFLVGAWLCLFPVATPYASDAPVIRINGLDYSKDELSVDLQQALYELEAEHYRKLRAVLDQAALEIYLADEVERTGKSKAEISAQLFAVPKPSEAAVKRFYDANQRRIERPFEAVKPQIARMLKTQAVQTKLRNRVEKLEADGVYQRLVTVPVAPYAELKTDGYPQQGAANATVTIVEFADYQCPHCKDAASTLKKLMHRYGDRVRLVFKDFPLKSAGMSRKLAEAAFCAGEQGKFWPYHYLVFDKQEEISAGSDKRLAKELKLDEKQFQACLDSERPSRLIDASKAEATANGIHAAPTLFINGRRLEIFDMETDIQAAIEAALKKKS